jgi:hypothetical protein
VEDEVEELEGVEEEEEEEEAKFESRSAGNSVRNLSLVRLKKYCLKL